MAIDIAGCRPLANFEADMERLIKTMKTTPCAPGVEEIFYPGEIEARHDVQARETGLHLSDNVARELAEGAADLGVPSPI